MAGLQIGDGGIMVDRLGMHGADEAKFIGHARGVRQQLTDPGAAFTMTAKFE
jgi:hypothetical protein